MNYAIIQNNEIVNIIVAENETIAMDVSGASEVLLLENNDLKIGWTRVEGVWKDPFAPEPQPESLENSEPTDIVDQ